MVTWLYVCNNMFLITCPISLQVKIAGHDVRAIRLTFVGEMGWELHIPAHSCVDVYRAVMAAGQRHGIVNAGKFLFPFCNESSPHKISYLSFSFPRCP